MNMMSPMYCNLAICQRFFKAFIASASCPCSLMQAFVAYNVCEQHAGQNIAKDSKSVINTVQACNKEASSKNHVTSNAVTNKEDDYPERLNPFSGDDDNDENSSNLVMSRGNKNKNSRLRSFIDKDYPEELNPFRNYPEELNPFRDHDDYPEELNPFRNDYPEELNPFGNDDPEELNPFKEDEMQINEAEGDLEKSCVAIDTMTKASTKKHMSLMSLVKRIANFLGF